jgi:methionyl aminopeptidase
MEDKYVQAGGIAAEVIKETMGRVREGAKLLDVAVFAEGLIKEKEAKSAFPINISVNERAAHYTPDVDETTVFKKGDLVKIDIGVHVDGYIGDIARSKAIGSGHKELIKAAEAGLENAINAVKPGAMTNEIGGIVEKTIKERGFFSQSIISPGTCSPSGIFTAAF